MNDVTVDEGPRAEDPGFLKTAITYGVFPIMFFGAMATAVAGMHAGYADEAILVTIMLVTVGVIVVCERLNPHFDFWNQSQDDIQTDVMHTIGSQLLLPALLQVVLALAFFGVAERLSEVVGFAVWPSSWNLVAQLGLALLISQFNEYWAHRLMHTVPLLWRLHATHHSPGRLYWLNAGRFHPFDAAFLYTVSSAPLLALGVGKDVLLLWTLWIGVHGLFQHCNIHLKLGPLNYLFSMAELHRWHHSLKLEEANSNYGNNIIFWDLVFGTLHHPSDREASADIGLSGLDAFPKTYFGQLSSPFRWRRIESASESVKAETSG